MREDRSDEHRRRSPGRRPTGAARPGRSCTSSYGYRSPSVWLFPLLWAVLTSLRSYAVHRRARLRLVRRLDHRQLRHRLADRRASASTSSTRSTSPSRRCCSRSSSPRCVAFVIARFSWKLNIALLGLFTAANLLPQQALLIPLFRMFTEIPLPAWMSDSELLYDSYWGLILVNVAFQCGFCVFVLSNYMKALPHELYEAAMVDGASVWRQYWQVTMPLCRPALAALATLEVTWIYNEFFWATVLMRTGDKFPVTSSLNNLRGQFFTDNNLVSAGSVLVAIPTLVIFFLLQKQFVRGLTLGASKG